MGTARKIAQGAGGLLLTALQAAVGISIGAWQLWCTWIAFVGGRVPVPFVDWHLEGGFVQGLLYLFVVMPLVTGVLATLLAWVLALLLTPIILLASRRAEG